MKNISNLSKLAETFNNKGSVVIYLDEKELENISNILSKEEYSKKECYGIFVNSKELSLKLGFKSVFVDGVTFHFNTYNNLNNQLNALIEKNYPHLCK